MAVTEKEDLTVVKTEKAENLKKELAKIIVKGIAVLLKVVLKQSQEKRRKVNSFYLQ